MPRKLRQARAARVKARRRKVSQKTNRPPSLGSVEPWWVRVKRWGKSPPRRRQRRRHDKPLPVQGKIGGWAARPIATGMPHPPALAGASARAEGGHVRREADLREMTAESRASGRNRIRLTGPKAKFLGRRSEADGSA